MEQSADYKNLSIAEQFRLGYPIHEAMLEGTRHALEIHDKLGQDVVIWRDGKIAIVPAAEALKAFKPRA